MTNPLVRVSAPGKIILFGEHAVVYGEPAIAVPVTQVEASAVVALAAPGTGLLLVAADLGESYRLLEAPPRAPLALAARLTLDDISAPPPDATLTVESTIPIASGLGSGAAVSTALVRALAAFLGHQLEPDRVSALVYEVEKIHHGTPSGIDNTVIAYEQPVYFVRGVPSGPELLSVGAPIHLVVADSGLPSPTKRLVSQVRALWEQDRAHCQRLVGRIGAIAREARQRIQTGDIDALGPLMDQNHALLVELGVSSPALDRLVSVAREGGAMGAKLSGAGGGGNVLALIQPPLVDRVAAALRDAGAVRIMATDIT